METHLKILMFSRPNLSFSKEVSRQMNSVFRELLSRQPPLEVSGSSAPPSSPPPASVPSVSSAAARPPAKKGGFGLRSRGLFKPQDQQDWGRGRDDFWVNLSMSVGGTANSSQIWIYFSRHTIYGTLYALLAKFPLTVTDYGFVRVRPSHWSCYWLYLCFTSFDDS